MKGITGWRYVNDNFFTSACEPRDPSVRLTNVRLPQDERQDSCIPGVSGSLLVNDLRYAGVNDRCKTTDMLFVIGSMGGMAIEKPQRG